MSEEVKGAARKTDLVEHQSIQAERVGKIANAAFSTAKTAYEIYRVAKLASLGAGPPGWIAFGVSFVVEYAVGKVIDGAVKYYIAKNRTGIPGIATGSPNVFINKLEGARGQGTDTLFCHTVVEQGSRCVTYNQKPASRLDDKTKCPGVIATASTNVVIGGPPTYYNPDAALDTALFVLNAYNAMKSGMVGEAVKKGATGLGVLKEGMKEIGKEGLKEAKNQLWDERAKPWAKSEGLWPW